MEYSTNLYLKELWNKICEDGRSQWWEYDKMKAEWVFFFLIIIFLGTHLRTLYIAFLLRRGVLNLEH